eukprot:CAMPEP_0181300040 /NCGR_PEP_ID=MMETSP1101-20121128/6672_1 /TAXON_ID=46948 /ORGANISM="Rhodomonas abbreviata, Strain Caron Lab Isolate" /LENGTH=280 /DNA_ID=CAMNT_0023405239 /DNA_START=42 /DNA_END=881 /DNA_ORIENTATION=-
MALRILTGGAVLLAHVAGVVGTAQGMQHVSMPSIPTSVAAPSTAPAGFCTPPLLHQGQKLSRTNAISSPKNVNVCSDSLELKQRSYLTLSMSAHSPHKKMEGGKSLNLERRTALSVFFVAFVGFLRGIFVPDQVYAEDGTSAAVKGEAFSANAAAAAGAGEAASLATGLAGAVVGAGVGVVVRGGSRGTETMYREENEYLKEKIAELEETSGAQVQLREENTKLKEAVTTMSKQNTELQQSEKLSRRGAVASFLAAIVATIRSFTVGGGSAQGSSSSSSS